MVRVVIQRWRTFAFAAVAVLISASLASCSAPSVPDGRHTNAGNSTSQPTVIAEPFAALWVQQEGSAREIHTAMEQTIAGCMQARGFRYTPAGYRPRTGEPLRFGDIAAARDHGFRIVDAPNDEPPDTPDLDGLSPAQARAWSVALLGEPVLPGQEHQLDVITVTVGDFTILTRRNTCLEVARREIAGDAAAWLEAPAQIEDLANQVRAKVARDPRMIVLEREWEQCMSDAGFGGLTRLTQTERIQADLAAGRRSRDQIRTDEIALAVASAECDVAGNVADVYRTVQGEHETAVLDANQGIVIRWAELNAEAARKARER